MDSSVPMDPFPGNLNSLYERLDALWIKYLDLLEGYTIAQASIKRHMSSGFLSLAQANSKSSGSGRRYGRDYYDQRALATARVEVRDGEEGVGVKIVNFKPEMESEDFVVIEKGDAGSDLIPSSAEDGVPTQLATPKATPEPETKPQDNSSSPGEKKPIVDQHDPLRWFGILLPPALRQTQKSFALTVLDDDALAKAVNSARGMRNVEAEIRRLRKVIRKVEKAGQ